MPAETDGAFILSLTDVRNIRSYVQYKYAAMPQEEKAEIVADAVVRIIRRQLPAFGEPLKKRITAELIRTAVLQRQQPVRSDDILRACLPLGRSDPSVLDPLHRWAQLQLRLQADKRVFAEALDKLEAGRSGTTEAGHPGLLEELRGLLLAGGADGAAISEPNAPRAEIIPLPSSGQELVPEWTPVSPFRTKRPYVYGLFCVILLSSSLLYGWSLSRPSEQKLQPPVTLQPAEAPAVRDGLPRELRYTTVDKNRLASYLGERGSLLSKQPYFGAILETAEAFDIHPLLLFAITGQEQGFVPETNKRAKQIANNPFNVFHSWKEYNTDIYDSAAVASRTIIRLSKNRPDEVDPIVWINREYAEDPNWSAGVKAIFDTLRHEAGTPSKRGD